VEHLLITITASLIVFSDTHSQVCPARDTAPILLYALAWLSHKEAFGGACDAEAPPQMPDLHLTGMVTKKKTQWIVGSRQRKV
jgi:adenylylsulfate kinase-like enzyme